MYYSESGFKESGNSGKYDGVLAQHLVLSIDKSIKKEQRSK